MKKISKLLLTIAFMALAAAFAVGCGKSVVFRFQANDGSEITSVKVDKGSEYSLPDPGEREGYEFEGWYLQADFNGSAVETVKVDSEQTFYAKWNKLCKITLDLNGGTLSQTTLYLKEGSDLYSFMQAYVPQKSGLQFGSWFAGEAELSPSAVVSGDISLTARYKAAYTVELWCQNIEKTGYEKVEQDITGYAYAGQPFTSVQALTGFTEIQNANSKTSVQALSEKSAENVFRHYFDRQIFKVIFNTNYPDGSQNTATETEVVYGQEVAVPADYTAEGYYLAGWAESSTGKIVYGVNGIEPLVYNKENGGSQGEAVTFIPERNLTLYAIWTAGYTDMFGGEDIIYLFDAQSAEIYLSRGGLFFKGTYYPSREEFIFRYNGEILLEGKLIDDETYAYFSSSRYDTAATLCRVTENGLEEDSSTRILLDEYNGITYYVTGEDGRATNSKGTYYIDGDGNYVVTFEAGELAGQEMVICISTTNVNGAELTTFSIRDEEEYNLGKLIRFERMDKTFVTFIEGYYDLTLNGFGVALYNNGNATVSYYYLMNDAKDTVTLIDSMGETMGVFRIMEQRTADGMTKGYMVYDEALDQTFTTADGATLTLDGLYSATYRNGRTRVSGDYSVAESVFGGYIIVVEETIGSTQYTFMLAENEPEEGADPDAQPTYTLEIKTNGYAEYYYSDDSGIYYAPLMVLNDTAAGHAALYGYTSDKSYVKVSEGSYQMSEELGHYVYVAFTIDETTNALTSPVNIARIKSVVFDTGVTSRYYSVNYWFSHTTVGDVTKPYGSTYVSSNGATLELVGGFAIYTDGENTVTGYYSLSQDGKIVSVSGEEDLVFELDGDGAFVRLTFAPYTAYSTAGIRYTDNALISYLKGLHDYDETEALEFDGKGGATYKVIVTENGTERVTEEITGSVTATGEKTGMDAEIYSFESAEKSFTFIRLFFQNSAQAYFAEYDGYGGDYSSRESGLLTLDGYGYQAVYTDSDGIVHEGQYVVVDEGVVLFIADEEGTFFDLTGDRFAVRGDEYGSYVLVDNWAPDGTYFDLDGHGNLRVYTIDETSGEETVLDDGGVYEKKGDIYTLRYTANGSQITVSGSLGVYTFTVDGNSLNGSVFVKMHEQMVRTYVNQKDWSVLVLDSLGVATKYAADGKVENGRFILITDDLLYYENLEGTDAYIYNYATENNTVEPVNLTAVGYYTEDLNSIVFTQYGFAVFNGTERYYYNIEYDAESNGKVVVIYKQDATDANASSYGFVREVFGSYPFEKEKVYGEGENARRYTINNGTDVVFKREEATGDKYPVTLTSGEKYPLGTLSFAPSGEDEFAASGVVQINNNAMNCTVYGSREGNVLSLELVVDTYSFDIEVVYKGEDEKGQSLSTYSVTGMQGHATLYPYDYLDTVYLVSMYYGPAYAAYVTNDHGVIDIVRSFDEEGNEVSRSIDALFLEGSGMYDIKGNLLSLSGASYETVGSSGYIVSFEGGDGHRYKMYFDAEYHAGIGLYGYYLTALTRVQTLESAQGYTLEVERIISSMASLGGEAGSIFTATLKMGEEEIPYWNTLQIGDDLYYISRTEQDGKYVSTTYYRLVLTDAPTGEIGASGVDIVPLYAEEFEIEKVEAATYYSESGRSFVDVSTAGNRVLFMVFEGSQYLVKESAYDEESQTYTVTTEYDKFLVRINGDTIEIEEVAANP